MKRLILFTSRYPYSTSETFIENEIEYLCRSFDSIEVYPMYGGDVVRQVPSNCHVSQPLFKSDKELLKSALFKRFPLGFFIKNFFTDKAYRSFSILKKYIAAVVTATAINRHKNILDLKKTLTDRDVMYFYWGIGISYFLPLIQSDCRKVVRFHGTDIYLERRANRYIPLRKALYSNLSTAVYISESGLKYDHQHYSDIPHDACLSYLGTRDCELGAGVSDDQTIRIVSCAAVVPVKRIDLIYKGLCEIKDKQVEWTHIGGGDGLDEIQKLVIDAPSNIKVNLAGTFSNQQVIEWYKANKVDMIVNVSSSEGLPVAIMEAISFGVGAVATDVGGTSEIVTRDVGILIPADFKPQELAGAIVELYNRRGELNPRKLWEQKFSAENNYPKFIDEILLKGIK